MYKSVLNKEVPSCHTFLASPAQSLRIISHCFFICLMAQFQPIPNPVDSCSPPQSYSFQTSLPRASCPLPVSEVISLSLNCNHMILTLRLHPISPFQYKAVRLISRKHNSDRLCHFHGQKTNKKNQQQRIIDY